jgi:hypothetical protein
LDVLTAAAKRRARSKATKLLDAIHLASAEIAECDAFISSDQRLGAGSSLPTLQLGPAPLADIEARFA